MNLTLYSVLNEVSEEFYSIDYLRNNNLDIDTQKGYFKLNLVENYREVDNILCFKDDLLDYFKESELDNLTPEFFSELKNLLSNKEIPSYTHSSNLKVRSPKFKAIKTPFPMAKYKTIECFNKSMVKVNQAKKVMIGEQTSLREIEPLLPIKQPFKELIYYFYCLQLNIPIKIEELKKIKKSDLTMNNINESILISAALTQSKSFNLKL
ncbi:hypothetical protein [Myroides injenensis]|uniref:hypothetical protein n=1 Tax=Myroides injenensis TaxID=1183151 RepID=UPI00226EFD17|nr:hypothetical protein [Myroides injenensis]